MRISKVDLFKLPIDNSYTNVIDISDVGGLEKTKKRLYDTINSFYATDKQTFDGLSRSIKRVGNSTLLTLPISYEDGRNYNYMIINDADGNYYFYFVTNIISENDSEVNPTATFTLEWDVWNNNIEQFKNVNNTIIKKHYDRVEFIGSKPRPNFLVQFSNIDLPKNYKEINIGERYLPLFAVFTLSEINSANKFYPSETIPVLDSEYTFTSSEGNKNFRIILCDGVSNRYNKNVIYMLIGMIDTNNNKYVSFEAKGTDITFKGVDNIDYTYSRTFYFNDTTELYIPPSLSPYINDISLSFHCPYYYNIDTDDGFTIEFPYNSLFAISDGALSKLPIIAGDYVLYKTDTIAPVVYAPPYKTQEFITTDILDLTDYSTYLNDKEVFTNPQKHFLIDPITYTPPFTSVFITYNNENFPLTVRDKNKTLFKIQTSLLTSQPNFKVINGGQYQTDEIVSGSSNKFIRNSGYLSFGKNSIENYLLKNGGQIEINKLSSIIGTMVNIVKFGAGIYSSNPYLAISGGLGTINDVTKLMSIDASINDAQRTPDEWVTNSGECDIFYQDRIRFTMQFVDRSNPAFIQFMNGVYSQGYSFPSFDSPFKNSRLIFDYVKTSGCDLSPLSINSNDREKLEEIFNRGVTKWHMWSKGGILQFNKYMIKDPNTINNLEQITETNSAFKTWLYGT